MPKTAVASKFLILLAFGALSAARADNLLHGTVGGYQCVDKDDRVDGSVVFQSLKASALMSFQINDLVAPDENMKAGPLSEEVPGNVHFPTQKEKWGIFPITLAKNQFSVPYKAGVESELFAMGFSLPFGELIDKRNNPYSDLVDMVTLRSYGMTDSRDWSGQQNISITLDRSPVAGANYTWTRGGHGDHEWDVVVAFQANAKKRWVVADFQPDPATTGTARRVPGLENDSAYLFMRIHDTKDRSEPQSLAATFVRSADAAITVDGVPNYLSGVKLSGKTLSWDPINQPGWMAVLRGTGAQNFSNGAFAQLGLASIARFGAPLLAWVEPAAGQFNLGQGLDKNDTLTLLFVKTDADVAMPEDNDNSDEPELFQHAQQMSAQILQ